MVFLLVVSILLLFVAVGMLGGTIAPLLSGGYHEGDVSGLILLSAIGVVCLALGLLLFTRSVRKLKARRAQRAAGLIPPKERKKLGKGWRIALICVGAYAVLIAVGVCGKLATQSAREKAFHERIEPRLGTEYSTESAYLPEDPLYIVYDTAKGECVSRPDCFPKNSYTNNIKKANVLVYCQKDCGKIGYWYAENSMVPIADAWAETYTVSIVRIDDWSLLAQQTFSKEGYDTRLEGYTYVIYLSEQEIGDFVSQYLD